MTKFKDLGLKDEVLRGVTDQGFEEAFEIQEAVIPVSVSYTHLTLPTILLV